LNGLTSIITPHFFGLGDKNEIKDFIVPNNYDDNSNPGMLSLLNTEKTNDTQKEKVTIKRLDDLDLDNISLIKIDVEGYELEVFEGGQETIQRNRPVILIEIWKKYNEKYFSWIHQHFPFYRIDYIDGDDYILIPT
jgi:FkbM family methyltransferase